MSFAINATQAKWFGFQPKYVWDEFVREHSSVARKIKTTTFSIFMEIEECENRIKNESSRILEEEKIDAVKYAARAKMKREEGRRAANMEMVEVTVDVGSRKRMRYEEVLEREEKEEEGLEEEEMEEDEREETRVEVKKLMSEMKERIRGMEWDKEDEDVKLLHRIHIIMDEEDEYDGYEAYISKLLEMYGKERKEKEKLKEEVESLKAELKDCQRERDVWRKKYHVLSKTDVDTVIRV
ncbi:hypothetical protein HDU85_002672 [Gaertneriomyces sp. JEL0708]|nr:hypothetical protein HDU85_002672 [Gaertneriomyces sp. JEL0708]